MMNAYIMHVILNMHMTPDILHVTNKNVTVTVVKIYFTIGCQTQCSKIFRCRKIFNRDKHSYEFTVLPLCKNMHCIHILYYATCKKWESKVT